MSGGGGAAPASHQSAAPGDTAVRGSSGTGFSDDAAELGEASRKNQETAEAQAIARQIAGKLAVRRTRRRSSGVPSGRGIPTSMPYRGGSDDLDLDRTLETMVELGGTNDSTIFVRDRLLTRRTVILAVDVSGSMRGERVRTAAATVGALAGELRDDRLGVIAFWSDAAVLLSPGCAIRPSALLTDLLALPAEGLTNVSFPLELAARLLRSETSKDQRVLLLTDALHNAGPDPRLAAARLQRVDVLLDASGESDELLGREIAQAGRGRALAIRSYREVAQALTRTFMP